MAGIGTTLVMNDVIEEFKFASMAELVDVAADTCQQQLLGDKAPSLMVSGGSTPLPLYERLARIELGWQNISVGLVDERWVGPEHAASNERAIQQHLLQDCASVAQFVPMKNQTATAWQGAAQTNADYERFVRPYSLTVLGMGPDGHSASWFPHSDGLESALTEDGICYPITAKQSEVTGTYTERMTLGLKAVLSSKLIVLLINGEKKWQVYEQAKAEANAHDLPISALFANHEQAHIQVYWAP